LPIFQSLDLRQYKVEGHSPFWGLGDDATYTLTYSPKIQNETALKCCKVTDYHKYNGAETDDKALL